ncbi:MAG: M48 family metalloprotease [Chloroflexota bacterium]
MKKLNLIFQFLLLAIISVVTTTCAVNPVTGKTQVMLVSEAQELQMGKEYDPQVVASFGEYKNDAILSFVTAKSADMGKISHRPQLEYHLKLLDSPVVNAFAVPGGYIYLTRGILAQFNNEAELMGVIGHEMGHVTARHSASQQTKQQLGQVLLAGGMLASQKFAQYGQQAMQGMQLIFLKFSRDDEREADRLGVEYMSKIGYDANKMADFFDVLNKMSSGDQGGVPTFLSTHPDPGDRNNSVKSLAKFWQDTLKKSDWLVNGDSYLKMIDGVIYGDDPRQGYTEGNVFYHPEMKFRFTYPAGWQFENSPMQVATAPKDGKAMVMFSVAQQKTPEEAAQAAAKQYGLTVVESKNTTVNTLPAVAVLARQVQQDQSTGQQLTNQLLSYYINYGGLIYVFHGVSAEADFKTYQPSMESTLNSFAALTDPAKINVKPKKIIIKTVSQPATLSQLFTAYGIPQKQMAELALLNNLELTSNVPAGKLIKIIGE